MLLLIVDHKEGAEMRWSEFVEFYLLLPKTQPTQTTTTSCFLKRTYIYIYICAKYIIQEVEEANGGSSSSSSIKWTNIQNMKHGTHNKTTTNPEMAKKKEKLLYFFAIYPKLHCPGHINIFKHPTPNIFPLKHTTPPQHTHSDIYKIAIYSL